jgi:hypothetical protein
MISSTSITSTMGVTLISLMAPPPAVLPVDFRNAIFAFLFPLARREWVAAVAATRIPED